MNIASVSNKNYSLNSNSNNDNSIKLLEKQKMELQERIQKINESKDEDPKIKQEKIKEIQEQIQEIESQIQMLQTEKIREKQKLEEKNEDRQVENVSTNADGDTLTLSNMTALINSSNSYSQLKTIDKVKTNLNGTARVLKTEIKLDELRGVDTTVKKKTLKETEKGIRTLDERVGEENAKIQKGIEKSAEAVQDKDKDEDRIKEERDQNSERYL